MDLIPMETESRNQIEERVLIVEIEKEFKDYYKAYNEYFGKWVESMRKEETMWKQAEIRNKMDMALQTRDIQWFMELRRELDGWM